MSLYGMIQEARRRHSMPDSPSHREAPEKPRRVSLAEECLLLARASIVPFIVPPTTHRPARRNRRPSYNLDSVVDCIDPLSSDPARYVPEPLFHQGREEPMGDVEEDPEEDTGPPPPWSQVREQFNYALDCILDGVQDEANVLRQRQAFLSLWTLHALGDRRPVCF